MIRPPSIQKVYTAWYSRDPAILPLPAEATDEQKKERERLIKIARETGDLSAIQVPGEIVTLFKMRPLSVDQFGELASLRERGEGGYRMSETAFRFALLDATPLPDDIGVKFTDHPRWGKIATTSFLDDLKLPAKLSAEIVSELGDMAIERAADLSPKS